MANKLEKKIDLDQMKTLAYSLKSSFKEWLITKNYEELMSELTYVNYHNFSKSRLPFYWYQDLLNVMNLTTDDVLVEIVKVDGNHNDELHYHKISHALCIILGPQTGFNNCYSATIIKDSDIITSEEDLEVYFPSFCKHTFNVANSKKMGSLYFLSIQSPPLLTKTKDDFYLVVGENN